MFTRKLFKKAIKQQPLLLLLLLMLLLLLLLLHSNKIDFSTHFSSSGSDWDTVMTDYR